MQNSRHWVDKTVQAILKWQAKNKIESLHVDDMKTPSGRVHTGALRGVLLHDIVHKALAKGQSTAINTYVFNDMDPMDSLPGYLDKEQYEQYMGVPLHRIPTPDLDHSGVDFSNASDEEKDRFANAKSFGEFYALDFIEAFEKLGATPQLVWSHELYESGQMDGVIRIVLDNVDKFRKIYKDVADYELPPLWYPFQVICPECGKVGTTLTTDWDGTQVTFECQPNKVEWAKGCGYQGKISPFGGTGKLLWKVDWPAHWQVMGVNVEGAGKDHTSAGGSRDMANAIVEKVFKNIAPFDIPYEWILIRGTKMSSSKGIGTSAREFVELFPTVVGRFLFVNEYFGRVIDFDPATMAIPDLFDLYDQGARIYWQQETGDERLGRSFELSQIDSVPDQHFLPRFRDVALWMQYPEIELQEKFAEIKGSELTKIELDLLEQRKDYAKLWLNRYAPEEFQYTPKPELPIQADQLTSEQTEYLIRIHEVIDEKSWQPQELQQKLFDLAKDSIGAKLAFQAIYLAYLGKTSGPRAGWLLLSLSQEFRMNRILQLTKKSNTTSETKYETLANGKMIHIHDDILKDYANFRIGLAVIKGVKIKESPAELKTLITQTFSEYESWNNEMINSSHKVQSYRKAIKQSGIDWHSRRPTMDALLRRLSKKQHPPFINNIADIGNMLAVKYQMSQGLFDYDKFSGKIEFRPAQGGEQTVLYGSDEPITLKQGEICYFDDNGAFAVDLCWRDAQRTAVTSETNNLLVQTEGVFDITRPEVEQMLTELISLITKYCGGTVEISGIIEGK